jgi:ribosomal protein S18 acetylase RimI-like enzyme
MGDAHEQAYTIRDATIADCEELATMSRRLRGTMQSDNPDLWPMAETRSELLPEFHKGKVEHATTRVVVAETRKSGRSFIVGMATGSIGTHPDVPRFGSVDDVWVDPEHRREGVCRSLIAALLGFFRDQEIEELTLTWVAGSEAATAWKRLGFRPVLIIANATVDDVTSRM